MKSEKIPEEWATLGAPSLYVMKCLRERPRQFVGAGGATVCKGKYIFGSWNIIWSLLHRGFIEQRKDGKWQVKSLT